MRKTKKRIICLFLLACIPCVITLGMRLMKTKKQLPELPDRTRYATLTQRADKALDFAQRHNLNERYAIFVDYSIPSGTPRLFVWDFKKQKVIHSAHVMHGSGGGSTAEKPRFSTRPGSNCSSLGRFAVTKHHGAKIQRSFRLNGMDIDNRSAFNRGLMIHSARWVERHKHKKYIPLNENASRGCVTVAPNDMTYIWNLVNNQDKDILLWNYS